MNPLELLQTPVSQRFGWSLLHFVWQGTVLAAVAWVCASGLGRSNARVRYALNVTCLLAMVACVGVTYALAEIPVAERSSNLSLAAMRQPGKMAFAATGLESPGPAKAISPPGQTNDQPTDNAASFSVNSIQWRRHLPYAMLVYWLGVVAILVRLVIGLQGGQQLRRLSRPVDEGFILHSLTAQAHGLGMSYVPAVAYCRRIVVPVVVGVIRPTILLPLAFAANLTPEQIEMLLAHELAHIRRLDPLVNVLQRIIEAVLFFHPAVWFVSHRIRIEREHCCDDLAVRAGGGAEAYASSLLTMAQRAIHGPTLPEAMAVVKKTSRLRVRLRRILGLEAADSLRLRHTWLIVTLVALASILIVGAHLQAQESSSPDKSEARYGGGIGTLDKPYLIYTADQLDAIGRNPRDWHRHFTLMTDIDLIDYQGNEFHLIGNDTQPFTGVFDGDGHTIANFTYIVTGNEEHSDETVTGPIGFFRNVNGPNAVIIDLGLIAPSVHPASTCSKRVESVGALVGSFGTGLITNCHVEGGSVRAEGMVGGLVGTNSGIISKCYTTCLVQSAEPRFLDDPRRNEYLGGIVGLNLGEITRCHATGDVSGEAYIGGLAGRCLEPGVITNSWASGDISGVRQVGGLLGGNKGLAAHCYATGRVTGQFNAGGLTGSSSGSTNNCHAMGHVSASNQGGGLFGSHSGVLSECYATGSVVVSSSSGGGLVGFNSGTIQRCFARSQVSGGSSIGGLVGANRKGVQEISGFPLLFNGIIKDSYCQSSVSGSSSTGGLIGSIEGGVLSRCYAAGEVTGSTRVGGLVGFVGDSHPVEIEQSFWDISASHQEHSAGGIGVETDSMQETSTFLVAGWDFTGETTNGLADSWTMNLITASYPQLAWDIEPEPFLIFEFDEDPHWATQGQWQFGEPQGLGGIEYGHADPNAGYTGNNVYGVNLSGDYDTKDTHPYYLIAGPFDCSQYSWVKLQFARWLNSDEADFTKTFVDVSTNGTVWQPIWEYDDFHHALEEDSWKIVQYDIGALANRQPTVYIRWGYQVLDNDAWPFSGWNIDDVILRGIQ